MHLLKNGILIDGTGRDAQRNAAVLVDGERISAVGQADAISVPPGTRIVDLAGRTIMPGIIDCHDHMVHTSRDVATRLGSPLSLTMMRIANNLRVTLEAGITTVRDAGGLDAGFKYAVEEGIIPGPRLVVSLVILSRTGGIGDSRLPTGIDVGDDLPGMPSPICDGVEECRKRVREVLHAGADVIKCASTGGVSSKTLGVTSPTFTYEELKVIADEAHMLGRRAMVHAYGGPGLAAAVEANIDSIEHGALLCQTPKLLDRMAEQGNYLVPTLMVMALHREHGSPWARRKAAELHDDHIRSIQMALEKEVPVVMGTDAGAYGHGHNAVELALLVEAGMTPMQAILASTKTAADCIGLGNDIGTLEPGKYADLLVVDGDPLADIKILDQPERLSMVMKGGHAYVDRLTSLGTS